MPGKAAVRALLLYGDLRLRKGTKMICELHDVGITITVRDLEDNVLSTIRQRADFVAMDVDRGVSFMGVENMHVDAFDDDSVVLSRKACVNGVDCVVEAKLEAPLIAVTFDILDFHMTHA